MGSKHAPIADGTQEEKDRDLDDLPDPSPMGKFRAKVKTGAAWLLEYGPFGNAMTALTIYALVGDDVRLSLFKNMPAVDDTFYGIASLSLFMFSLEFTVSLIAKPGYGPHPSQANSFYMWLDLVSTVSIIPDIGWFWDPIQAALGAGGGEADNSRQALKAGKASRAGTKASRIIRLVRLVRMVRIVKLYKMHGGGGQEVEQAQSIEPSKVGKKLTEKTTKRLIVMILSMVLALPFGYVEMIGDSDPYIFMNTNLENLHYYPQGYNMTGQISEQTFMSQLGFYARKGGNLLYMEICVGVDKPSGCKRSFSASYLKEKMKAQNQIFQYCPGLSCEDKPLGEDMHTNLNTLYETYRENVETYEILFPGCYTCDDADCAVKTEVLDDDYECISTAIFEEQSIGFEAGMNIAKTIFIILVLGGGAVIFSKDAQVYVIGPIERMMTLVKKLAENPLESAAMDHQVMDDDKDVKNAGYETALLETTLERVGQLLQIGFGAAGAEIIGNNMNSASGKLNAMVPGKKICAIYGFCDIRQFTDTTECLQEEVMVYVNKLGHIVHSSTHEYYGMANKNVGDAFLLSWKLCDGVLPGFTNFMDTATEEERLRANESTKCAAIHPNTRAKRQITPSEMADSSVNAFLRCIIDLENENETGCLAEYATYEAVLKRFGPGFRIKMGFGMHVGWAVEGAIGSELKIDATYLSPHVEMSDRLEAASKIFGAKLNMSHWLVNLTTPTFRKYIRAIDCIKAEGVPVPLTVFTFDVKNYKPKFGTQIYDEKTGLPRLTDWNEEEFTEIQEGLHANFLPTFRRGFDTYIKGEWETARSFFEEALRLCAKDGPTMFLLNMMEDLNWQCPDDWKGYHELPEF